MMGEGKKVSIFLSNEHPCRDFVLSRLLLKKLSRFRSVEILYVSRFCLCRDYVLSRFCPVEIMSVEILSVSRFCLCRDFVRVEIMSCWGYALSRLCLSRSKYEDGKFLSMCVVFYRETVLAKLYILFLFHCKYCY